MSKSPVPKVVTMLTFTEALEEIALGKKVTKREWGGNEYYGVLEGGRLKIHKPDGSLYDWVISDGDMAGNDYVVL